MAGPVPSFGFADATPLIAPVPRLMRISTMPTENTRSDRSLLTPEDAIYQMSPPRKQSAAVSKLQKELRMTGGPIEAARRGRSGQKSGSRSGSRRRKGTWKKLLWVKQSCTSISIESRSIS